MTIKAVGMPQHVIDKLDFPALTTGYRWRVHKPFRHRYYSRYESADELTINVQIELDSRLKRYSEYRVVTDGPEGGRVNHVWNPASGTLVEALNDLAELTFQKFQTDHAGQLAFQAAMRQVEELFEK